MCVFSGNSRDISVSDTSIFVRRVGHRQRLVYSMHLSTPGERAMILPLPVAPGAGEDAVNFLDLSGYPDVFQQLDGGFIRSVAASATSSMPIGPRLRVHKVGAFEASYVPSRAEFARLDPRFRVDDAIWEALPGYWTRGFAVFQLRAGDQRIHPMAFDYPTRWPERLFLPTFHVHAGTLRKEARYDHSLYFQGFDRARIGTLEFGADTIVNTIQGICAESSFGPARRFLSNPLAAHLFDLDARVLRIKLRGTFRNEDHWLTPDPDDPARAVVGNDPSPWTPLALLPH